MDKTCANYVRCGFNQIVDPRYECKCSPRDEVKAFFYHNYDEKCERRNLGLKTARVEDDDDCVTGKYKCDKYGMKICLAEQKCPPGHYWDNEACMCFGMIKCAMMCQPGQDLDPRYGCKCVD